MRRWPKIPPVLLEPKPAESVSQAVTTTQPKPEEAEKEPPSPVPKVRITWSHALILALLIVIFLSLSLWNLGDRSFPKSERVPQKDPEEVYLDLGTTTRAEKVCLLV